MMITKKIFSLILAVIICVTSVPFAFATDADIDLEGITDFEETTTTEEVTEQDEEVIEPDTETTVPDEEPVVPDEDVTVPDEEIVKPEESKPLQDNDVVANFYVFLDESDVHPMGHTWLYVENLTDQELKVGVYTLPANEGVSVGVFKRKDGWGIYYNIEAYSQTVYGMEGQISMKEELTLKELRRVSNAIVNYLNHWDPIFNCMFFSFTVWDIASFKILLPLIFPVIGKLQMLIYPHETDVQMMPVTKEQTYRQKGMAGWAELVPATDLVLGPV